MTSVPVTNPEAAAFDPRVVQRLADMHAVYRMSDRDGRLLYIGRTGNIGQRFGDHSMKRWFPLVATITLEWFPTKAAAVLAERRAIISERPKYNTQVNRPEVGKASKQRPAVAPLTACPPQSAKVQAARRTPPDLFPKDVRAKLLGLLADQGTTASRAAIALGVSKWYARTWLEQLRREGMAEVVGRNRGARWLSTDTPGGDAS